MATQVWVMQILSRHYWDGSISACLFSCWLYERESASAVMFRRNDYRCTHTHTHESRAHVHITNVKPRPRCIGSKLFSQPKHTLPACRAVSQESLIMKAKIFYSDLLIWKWSVPVGRGTALLNLSSVSRTPVTPPYICLVVSDSRILPGASPPGITQGFFERNKTHSDKEQPLY